MHLVHYLGWGYPSDITLSHIPDIDPDIDWNNHESFGDWKTKTPQPKKIPTDSYFIQFRKTHHFHIHVQHEKDGNYRLIIKLIFKTAHKTKVISINEQVDHKLDEKEIYTKYLYLFLDEGHNWPTEWDNREEVHYTVQHYEKIRLKKLKEMENL